MGPAPAQDVKYPSFGLSKPWPGTWAFRYPRRSVSVVQSPIVSWCTRAAPLAR